MINLEAEGKELYRGIAIFDNVIEDPEELIEIGLADNRWEDTRIFVDGEQRTNPNVRDTKMLVLAPLVDYDPAWYFIAKALKQYGYRYANQYKAFFQSMEYPQMLHYPAGLGFYTDHVDSVPGVQRIFSAVLYLNTIEQGGETNFVDIGVSIKPVAGRLAIFPSNYLYRHEATTPISSDKFSIVTWYREDNG